MRISNCAVISSFSFKKNQDQSFETVILLLKLIFFKEEKHLNITFYLNRSEFYQIEISSFSDHIE
jgi:hypothetical protein